RLRLVGFPVSPRDYRGLPAFASLSLAGSEGTSIKLASEAAKNTRLSLDLPDSAFSYLTSHGALDISHMDFYASLINRLEDADDQRFVIHCAKRFYKLYGDIFRALPLSLNDKALAA
ncbi:MAG: iron-containing redox enzyme family protein, partial [Candidatus Thiodiazotropha sp.]